MSRPPKFALSIAERCIPAEELYQMSYGKRGRAIVFNQEIFDADTRLTPRSGSSVDAKNVAAQLKNLGFNTEVIHNMKMNDMQNLMQKIAKQDHSDADCFACVILSHGDDGGIIYARDGKVKLDDLLEPFKGDVCPTLLGKPKLFFIQACRGDKLDHGVVMSDGHAAGADDFDSTELSFRRIPTEADFLLAFSVIPGYYAWRNSVKGSWFIQALVDMLERYGTSLDLLSILTRVSHKVAFDFESNASNKSMSTKKQIPCIVSMLTKDLFFRAKPSSI